MARIMKIIANNKQNGHFNDFFNKFLTGGLLKKTTEIWCDPKVLPLTNHRRYHTAASALSYLPWFLLRCFRTLYFAFSFCRRVSATSCVGCSAMSAPLAPGAVVGARGGDNGDWGDRRDPSSLWSQPVVAMLFSCSTRKSSYIWRRKEGGGRRATLLSNEKTSPAVHSRGLEQPDDLFTYLC